MLRDIPFERNSDDFVFDSEMIVQAVACGFRISEASVPSRYFDEASSVNFWVSLRYGTQTMRVMMRYLLHRLKIRPNAQFVRVGEPQWQKDILQERHDVYSTKPR